jgi:hypothetical protein
MLYGNSYPLEYWDLWLNILLKQIPFKFEVYKLDVVQEEVVLMSPDKKNHVSVTTDSWKTDSCDDSRNHIVLTTNSGAFHIIAEKNTHLFEIILFPFPYNHWNIFKFIQFQKEQSVLVKILDNIYSNYLF